MQELAWFEYSNKRGNWTTTIAPGVDFDVKITQTGANSFLLQILDRGGKQTGVKYNFPTLKAAQAAVDLMQDALP